MTKPGIRTAATGVLALVLAAAAGQAGAFPKPKCASGLDEWTATPAKSAVTPAASAAAQAFNAAAANRVPVVAPSVGPATASAPEAEPMMRAPGPGRGGA